jgi:formate C-acetyltransferase
MHDKYCYEAIEMALHDRDVCARWPAASRACRTPPTASRRSSTRRSAVRDERGLIVDFKTDGDFPCFGNNDDRVDDIAKMLVSMMMNKIRMYPTYRGAVTRSRC